MKFPEDDDSSGDNDDYDHDADNEEGWTDQSNPPEDDDSYDNGYDDADKRWFSSNLGAKRGEGECDGGGRHHPWGWT